MEKRARMNRRLTRLSLFPLPLAPLPRAFAQTPTTPTRRGGHRRADAARFSVRVVAAATNDEVTVKQTDLGDCKVRLEVTVPTAVQTEARQNCLEGFAEKTQIPGFAQYKKSGGRKKGANVLPPRGSS